MAAAVELRSRTGGTLAYYPPTEESASSEQATARRSFDFFLPRRTPTGRIRVQALNAFRPEPPIYTTSPTPQRLAWFNLAVSRESAKRFLRSVIQPPTGDTQQKKANRRSWSPGKRKGSVPSVAGGDAAAMRAGIRSSINGPASTIQRPRLNSDNRSTAWGVSTRTARSDRSGAVSPRSGSTNGIPGNDTIPGMSLDEEKPIASGNGVSVGITLAEPVLFLQGFDNNESAPGNTALLRGSLHVRVAKAAKIKAITLRFKGKSMTKWPEGIPPRKIDFEETNTIMSHTWPFFNAQFESAERGTCADQVQLFKSEGASSTITRLDPIGRLSPNSSSVNLTSREAKRLSLQVNSSRSFGKGDTPPNAASVAAKGYRTFLPGDYLYNFELPIDSRMPETIGVDLGSVTYELEASIERSGAFRANLAGTKEVILIRAPSEGSLETVEPIAISRNWEDQLHYDIVISGKSFPLGSQVPIAFKLTPLAKVQCHRIKVLVTENVEYFCANKHVHRMEPTRKVQLFEKRSDSDPTSTFPGSTMRITSGGGIPYDARARAARGENVTPADTTNLLGNLEGDSNIGPTEMEFNVQLPSCHTMKERDRSQRLHFDTTYQNIQVHHWIKIVMRLSKPDAVDPTKRRHFEISIDSPFHILSCRATQANTSLPAYTSPESGTNGAHLYDCGCPGATRRRNSPVVIPGINNVTNITPDSTGSDVPNARPSIARPPTVHLHGAGSNPNARSQPARPMHMLRAPSFNPPAFEDEEPPPPLITPPPQYDTIASPTSGLSDYFARLSDAYDDEDSGDEAHRGGRVNIPLTPGARLNRSMDLGRRGVAVGSAGMIRM
nr:hypothetical protein B0A51_08931 [Rachicladosporium sp. CCFEE 5018]